MTTTNDAPPALAPLVAGLRAQLDAARRFAAAWKACAKANRVRFGWWDMLSDAAWNFDDSVTHTLMQRFDLPPYVPTDPAARHGGGYYKSYNDRHADIKAALDAQSAELRMLRGDVPVPMEQADIVPLLTLMRADRDHLLGLINANAIEIVRLRSVIATNAAIARSSVSMGAIVEESERHKRALEDIGKRSCTCRGSTFPSTCSVCLARRAMGGGR